jgi:hypothetical protein
VSLQNTLDGRDNPIRQLSSVHPLRVHPPEQLLKETIQLVLLYVELDYSFSLLVGQFELVEKPRLEFDVVDDLDRPRGKQGMHVDCLHQIALSHLFVTVNQGHSRVGYWKCCVH